MIINVIGACVVCNEKNFYTCRSGCDFHICNYCFEHGDEDSINVFLEISLYKKDHYLTLCMIDLLSIGLPVLAGTLFVVLFMVLFNWLGPKLLYTTWLPIKTVCTILIWHYVSHLTDMEVIHPLQVSIAVGIPYAFFVLGMILVPRPYTLYASFPIFILTCVPIYWVYNNVIATSIYTGLYIIALVIAILLGHSGRFAEKKKVHHHSNCHCMHFCRYEIDFGSVYCSSRYGRNIRIVGQRAHHQCHHLHGILHAALCKADL